MIGLAWLKSSFSNPNGACVETRRRHDGHVLLRHSGHPRGPFLAYTPAEWEAFIAGVKAGEFDLAAVT